MTEIDPYEVGTWLAGTATGAGVAIAAWHKLWVKTIRPRLEARRSRASVDDNSRIFMATRLFVREILAKHGAKRVLCLSARNTGKPFPPDQPIYVSCVDQAAGHHTPNTWDRWQRWPCDPAYRQLICDVMAAGERGILIVTEHMESGVLKDAYAAQGTVASVVFMARWLSENALIYFSLNFGAPLKDGQKVYDLPEEERMSYERQARKLFGQPEEIRRMSHQASQIWADYGRG